MRFDAPPSPPQEKKVSSIETPNYWAERIPFKSPKEYFQLQFEFAKRMAERQQMPLVEAVYTYAPVIRNSIHVLGPNREVGQPYEGVTDQNMLETAWTTSVIRDKETNNTPTPYHLEGGDRFGCSYYDYNSATKTINVHFFNAEFEEEFVDGIDISKGPLDKSKIDRRVRELRDMFTDIKQKHPDAQYVNGRSSLYNLDAYRRLYPPTYEVGEIDYSPELWSQGTSIWGQFLGGNDKVAGQYGFKKELADRFLEKIDDTPLERLADALPNPPRKAYGDIQDFYVFYGIS